MFSTVMFSSPSYARTNSEDEVATLYRSSVVIENARMHVATFDAKIKAFRGTIFDYNWENCQVAANLFQSQPSVKTKFWCEKGFYRK